MAVRYIERIPTEQAPYLHGNLARSNVAVTAPLSSPETTEAQLTPDWNRAYFFAPEGEGVVRTPGVLELF